MNTFDLNGATSYYIPKRLDANISRDLNKIHHICSIKCMCLYGKISGKWVKKKNVSFHSNDGYEMEKYKLVELNWNINIKQSHGVKIQDPIQSVAYDIAFETN